MAAGTSSAGAQTPSRFEATALEPDGAPIQGSKSRVGQIAQTDPDLLGRSDSAPVNVLVKLDYDSVATYEGGVQGLAATSPKKTGKKLKQNGAAVDAYIAHVADVEQDIVSEIAGEVSGETVNASYRVAYGGVAMRLPANEIDELLSVDGVVAVQKDELAQPQTTVTPDFTGASAVWPSIGGSSRAGEGVIVGVLDTGVWPEHPSFADPGIDRPAGTFACEFGVGGDAAFSCNDKLIGAHAFTDTYMSVIGALPGENCINATDVCSARDADGHGTHTSSTAVGSPVATSPLFGLDKGPLSGMAPGAHLIMYRVCLDQGCFNSDSVAAVGQAILDGVDVINFSIGGGANAYTDAVELSFLDAYEAGILVNASAGNSGPGAATAGHAGPWVNTVAASTSNRHFFSTLRLTATGGDTLDIPGGVTVTAGITSPTDVVLASAPPYNNAVCNAAAAAGTFTGKVVVCERGNTAINGDATGRVQKGFNVRAGGAVGMILYNPAIQQLNSDNHWLSAIHLEGPKTGTTAPAARLLAFLSSHTGVKATWTTGLPTTVRGDVITSFSSRGPLGDFVKPDVTAPGIQILAGHTPDPFDANVDVGPPGQMFQAIAGTSMSSPHSAGIAALVKDVHPDWSPGQIKSSLMTSSVQDVLKENGVTPSDPFDRGAGSIRANRAVSPTVTFDVTAAQYVASATDPLNRVHLNLPSVNANPMPGLLTTTRTLKNVSGVAQQIRTSATSATGTTIDVNPKTVVVDAGETATIEITIDATGVPNGQYFGQITLDPNRPQYNDVVLPVAFLKGQGVNSLVHSCSPTTIARGESADCVVEAQNLSPVPAQVSLNVQGPNNGQLEIQNVSAPGVPSGNGFTWNGTLTPALAPTITSLAVPANPAHPAGGYLSLSNFPAIAPIGGVTDDNVVNFNVPSFLYGQETYTRLGIGSNGTVLVGGATSTADATPFPQTFPNVARPNNVLAPYWTDLNPPGGGTVKIGVLSGGGNSWIVIEWENVKVFSSASFRSFQVWIGVSTDANPGEDITYAFGGNMGPGDAPVGLNTGAENRDGTSGRNLFNPPAVGSFPASGSTLRVLTSGPTPGGKVTITYDAFGRNLGVHDILASMTSNVVQGTITDRETITVGG